jgi:hypothetical protein
MSPISKKDDSARKHRTSCKLLAIKAWYKGRLDATPIAANGELCVRWPLHDSA